MNTNQTALRILMTNNALGVKGGSELYVRDVATCLQKRGHQVIAYSPVLGEVADDIRAHGVPVVDDLADLTEAPDVIHGHHHLDVAAAGLRFPSAPIVHACHGWLPWQEAPLSLPSARRFVAISELTRLHLVTSGIAPERIQIIPSFVDLERFNLCRPAGPTRKVLAYGNPWAPGTPALNVIREACQSRGLEFEAVGNGMGNSTAQPQQLLSSFDIVFALGRSALEAMACGCAVIVADPQGTDGLVTTRSFDRQRSANFGLALIAGRPVTRETVGKALDEIDLKDVNRVCRRVRSEAGIEQTVDLWEQQYRLAIAEGPATPDETIAGASRFLVKHRKHADRLMEGWTHANNRMHELERELTEKRAQLLVLEAEIGQLSHAATEAMRSKEAETHDRNEAHRQLARMTEHYFDVVNSKSWRLTQPLRALRRLV